MRLRFTLFAVFLSAAPALFAADQYPGYGVVQSIVPVHPRLADQSASAGSSARSSSGRGASRRAVRGYLVKVRMDDGRYQIRQVKKREVRVGERVLITNAGDVVPDK